MTTRDTKKRNGIPQGVITRLPIYSRFLNELKAKDIQRVSSGQLGKSLNITAAQIRSDLSYFGSFGQHGYGYRVDELLEHIRHILGMDKLHHLILVGAGNLGRAIASYGSFRDRGFAIQGIFDSNPLLEGNFLSGCIIQPVSKLEEYLAANRVDIGVIATPRDASQDICDRLVKNNVRGIWNFSPIHLIVPQGFIVEHMHLTDSLLRISFKLREIEQRREETK